MKAVLIEGHGGPEVLQIVDRAVPEPGPAEVRIRVHAAAMNHLDCWVRRGVEGHHFPLPIIPGCDGAGVIDALGVGVSGLKVGDRVAIAPGHSCARCAQCAAGKQNLCRHYGIFGETGDGTDAEAVCIPAINCLPMPDDMPFEKAAAAPLVTLTAWHMLVDRCRVGPGDTVLVHAAGSGVSMAAIQIAKLFGARVFTTASRPEKLERALALGAEVAIDYTKDDFGKVVRKLTDKRGVDIIVDHVGGANISKSIRSLARGGRVVTCGATASPELATDLRLIFFKNLSILGSTMGGLGEMHEAWSQVVAGRIDPVIAEVLPLDEVRRGHELLESRAAFGKVVLIP
ncbi:MAG: zinc-binding dehydrogenase [Planctomycetes bacterium]|nr:zinc-binding dehydrogenase [Planctomycetota bacterium]